ncbi:MAG: L-seryl-tRNA(Sec) selenium transferase [Alphaproteobacteria bacterium]|nr:L-seryl-tRNA(Sec) selenium transferase [Alphaproteobacteria bacterium]
MADRGDGRRAPAAGAALQLLPSVDRVMNEPASGALVARYGRAATLEAVRSVLADLRAALRGGHAVAPSDAGAVLRLAGTRLAAEMRPSQRRVFNLTGTVLHTNLGRALLPREAIEAALSVMGDAANLEYDLDTGSRGERDAHVRGWLTRLTGAESATVVNNNAAAVHLVLNTLAPGREVLVSRGELVEIGGAFRVPDIMARAGARLVEVGTTNRTHPRDYSDRIGAETALVMKVHTSNYAIQGFTASVDEHDLAAIAHKRDIPFVVDLGSGTLVDLARWGLPHEPMPQQALLAGADLVTFSGDKLLGGPQCGIVVGRADLVARLDKNPMKRALRLDKIRLAALEAVLRLYADPDRLAEKLPTLRLLTRPAAAIQALGESILPRLCAALGGRADVELAPCRSQIGSGALPVDLLPSHALVLKPRAGGARVPGDAVERLAAAFRRLPVPVIGRIGDGALHFDLRCLEDVDGFLGQLDALAD